jgi:hypothetical protein
MLVSDTGGVHQKYQLQEGRLLEPRSLGLAWATTIIKLTIVMQLTNY